MIKEEKDHKKYIKIRGAKEHNLKDISLNIPRDEFVVLTGLSGSGSPRLLLIPFMQKGREDIWNLCHLMLDNSLDRWRNPMWRA